MKAKKGLPHFAAALFILGPKPLTAFAISFAVSPYSSSRSKGFPDWPNRSWTPIFLNLKSPFPKRAEATASPKPPITECSSAVTTFLHFLA